MVVKIFKIVLLVTLISPFAYGQSILDQLAGPKELDVPENVAANGALVLTIDGIDKNMQRGRRLFKGYDATGRGESYLKPKIDEKLLRNVRLGPTECFCKPVPRTAVVKYFGS